MDFLLRLTLYPDGTLEMGGQEPDDLPGLLRNIAQAAEADAIKWSKIPSDATPEQ